MGGGRGIVMKQRAVIAITLLLLPVSPGWGEIFQWEDASGGLHFVDSIEKVPPPYRSRVKSREVEPLPGYSFPPQSPPPAESPPPDEQRAERIGGGGTNGSDLAALEQERLRLQQELQAAHRRYVISLGSKDSANTPLNTIAIRRKEYQELRTRLDEVERKIESLKGGSPSTLP